jgi:hypothetical protein
MPERLPPIIKEYKYIVIYGITENQGINTGIYLNEGETYSVLTRGGLLVDGFGFLRLNEELSFEARIGQDPYFTPLSGTYYGLNGTTKIADSEGNLYLGLSDPTLKATRAVDGRRAGPMAYVSVYIIVWKTNDMAQIVGFLQEMKEKEANRPYSFINAIDDAIDQVKGLRQDFGYRTLDFGFAPEIVCVKNYRRVTP